ncbi:MAG: hypothetical protein JST93_06575 [Acidobacteria bacterium]|nr:hypothetical protein [Acidobacteriota bacterium]
MLRNKKLIAAAAAFAVGFASALMSAPPERFDQVVRNDFFAGFAGDAAAFERAMKVSSEAIAANPEHAEALVWHGSGLYFQAGRAFQSGDNAKGMELYKKAFAEMDRAVKLAPKEVGVRIPRGAVLLAATAYQPMSERVKAELRRAVDDYQSAYEVEQGRLDKMSTHSLGQLLLGLGDGHSRLGNTDQARVYFEMLEEKLPGTEYAKRAASWKQTGKLTTEQQMCIGCHVGK